MTETAAASPWGEVLALRVERERTRPDRRWSYERLSQEMGAAGCRISHAALHAIERGTPRRKITVDEYLAFAEVFGVEPAELLLPEAIATDKAMRQALARYQEAADKALAPLERLTAALADLVSAYPDHVEDLSAEIQNAWPKALPLPRLEVASGKVDLQFGEHRWEVKNTKK